MQRSGAGWCHTVGPEEVSISALVNLHAKGVTVWRIGAIGPKALSQGCKAWHWLWTGFLSYGIESHIVEWLFREMCFGQLLLSSADTVNPFYSRNLLSWFLAVWFFKKKLRCYIWGDCCFYSFKFSISVAVLCPDVALCAHVCLLNSFLLVILYCSPLAKTEAMYKCLIFIYRFRDPPAANTQPLTFT